MFFFGVKKERKTFGATQAPNPGALGGAGQEVNSLDIKKKDL